MAVKPDRWIRRMSLEHRMIEPFTDRQVREGVISYGLSSYGYDIRVADEFRIFTNVNSTIVDPKHFDAHHNLGLSLLNRWRLNEAINEFQEALSLQPKYTDANYNMGRALARQEKYQEAIAEFDKVLALKPTSSDAIYEKGMCVLKMGNWKQSVMWVTSPGL